MLSDNINKSHIPDELTANFSNPETRLELIAHYGDSDTTYAGENELHERVLVSISQNGIVTQTFQGNGWIREVAYDSQGLYESESYSRWREIGAVAHA